MLYVFFPLVFLGFIFPVEQTAVNSRISRCVIIARGFTV
jgi:hypothetical protein